MSEKHYQSEMPCKKCSSLNRYKSNNQCVSCKQSKQKQIYEANREQIIEKNAEWARNNKDKVIEYQRKYSDRHPEKLKEAKTIYAKNNPGKVKSSKKKWEDGNPEYMKLYRLKNLESLREKSKIYTRANSKKAVARVKKWVEDNPERAKENARRFIKQWRSTEEGKAISFMRGCITRCIKHRNIGKRTRDLIGYGHLEMIDHIEKQFEKWMTWDNYGEKWCIDHITPIKHFIDSGITDPKIINALSNLRPLCVKENSTKCANLYFLI